MKWLMLNPMWVLPFVWKLLAPPGDLAVFGEDYKLDRKGIGRFVESSGDRPRKFAVSIAKWLKWSGGADIVGWRVDAAGVLVSRGHLGVRVEGDVLVFERC